MADQKRWFKVWTSILSDDDFDPSRQDSELAIMRFTMLGAYMAQHGNLGTVEIFPDTLFRLLKAPNIDEIRTTPTLKNVLFEEGKNVYGKITVTWSKWYTYQEDSTAAKRVKVLRSKRREEKRREEEIRKEESTPSISPVKKLFTAWNQYASKSNLISARELSEARKSKCKSRLSEHPLEWWEEVFSLCARTAFLNGDNKNGWRASFDWIIANSDNAVKVLEGKYSSSKPDKGLAMLKSMLKKESDENMG